MGYIARAKWDTTGLLPKKRVPHPVTSKGKEVNLIVIHHTASSASAGFEATLRRVLEYHHGGKYFDIAYNGAADNSSLTWTDLRGPKILGGATGPKPGVYGGWDAESLSIVVPGNFSSGDKPRHAVESCARLIARWVRMGYVSKDFVVRPHRDFYATACCGTSLIPLMGTIADRARAIVSATGGTTVPAVEEDDGIMSVPVRNWHTFIATAKSGTYSPAVELCQRLLASVGQEPGAFDGLYGPKTQAAFEAWHQKRLGAAVQNNARPGWLTWPMLVDDASKYNVVTRTVTKIEKVPVVPQAVIDRAKSVDAAANALIKEISELS